MIQTTNVHDAWLGRTARLEYDNAIEFAGHLDWDGSGKKDILPGMVVKNLGNKELALYDGKGTPFGLAAIFVAPNYGKRGINQLDADGNFTAIVGNTNTTVRVYNDVLASDFKKSFDADGKAVPIYASNDAKLTTTKGSAPAIGVLNEIDDESIVVQLFAPAVETA